MVGAKHNDEIRDITGDFPSLRYGTLADTENSGAFELTDGNDYGTIQAASENKKRHVIKFKASGSVPTGPENVPNHVDYSLFIFVGRNPF